ncbi:hypothetical protein ACOSP7_019354 [Xanthoceras sorbifolium]
MEAFSIFAGYRFLPKDDELIYCYLFNRLFAQTKPSNDLEKFLFKECDLYGSQEAWDIWDLYGGNQLEEGQALDFFTHLKKVSVNGSRFCRRIGSGTWAGEDSGKKIRAGNVVDLKKHFRYENQDSPHDGDWIMHEFAIDSTFLRQH